MFVGVTSHIDFPTLTAWLEFAFAVPVRFELAAGIVTSPAVHPPITVDAIPYMRAVQDLKNWVDVVTSEFDADPPGYCPLIFDQDMERTAAGLWTIKTKLGACPAFTHRTDYNPTAASVTFRRSGMSLAWCDFVFWVRGLWRFARMTQGDL